MIRLKLLKGERQFYSSPILTTTHGFVIVSIVEVDGRTRPEDDSYAVVITSCKDSRVVWVVNYPASNLRYVRQEAKSILKSMGVQFMEEVRS